jgi:RNA polymerase sigma factor (sigma-70 family)
MMPGPWSLERYLMLDAALNRLTAADPQLARIFELHFFAGFEHAEIGEALGLTERQVRARWTKAKHWLRREIQGD